MIRTVVTGEETIFAIAVDGTLWGWGEGREGELGDPAAESTETPVQIAGPTAVVSVSSLSGGAYALTKDGALWAWGLNLYEDFGIPPVESQLGLGDAFDRVAPRVVPGLPRIRSVSTGLHWTYAVSEEGDVWSWGQNDMGQLGHGDAENRASPERIRGLSHVASIVVDHKSAYAVTTDGDVWVWGDNWHGKLGDGTTTDRWAPVKLSGVRRVSAIAVGGSTAIATLTRQVEGASPALLVDSLPDTSEARGVAVAGAVISGDGVELERLLKGGADANVFMPDGTTALAKAAERGQLDLVTCLLSHGADPSLPGAGTSPLHEAARRGHIDVVRVLIENGASPNNGGSTSPLMLAAAEGDEPMVTALVELGADVNAIDSSGLSVLAHAASRSQTAVVEALLALGAEPDRPTGESHATPLEIAARELDTPSVLALLRAGASPWPMYRARFALMIPNNGSVFIVPPWAVGDVLSRRDLSVGDCSSVSDRYWDQMELRNGKTPLMFWAANGFVEQVRHLLAKGADVHRVDRDGDDVLGYAVSRRSPEVLEALLEAGANPNASSSLLGRGIIASVLHVAAATGWAEGVRALLEQGADPGARATGGITPLMLAAGAGRDECVRLLSDHGVDLNAFDADGDRALFYAASNGHTGTVQLLLSLGADGRQRI